MGCEARQGFVVASPDGGRVRCRLHVPTGCEGQAGHARLLGHVFAGPRCRVRAWSDPAQPAVLNHILTTRLVGVMPLYELVCWLRPSVTPAPGWRWQRISPSRNP